MSSLSGGGGSRAGGGWDGLETPTDTTGAGMTDERLGSGCTKATAPGRGTAAATGAAATGAAATGAAATGAAVAPGDAEPIATTGAGARLPAGGASDGESAPQLGGRVDGAPPEDM